MITRYHPVLSVPVVTIRGMAGDQETVTAAAAVAAGGDLVPRAGARPLGPVAIAAELLARTRAELPVLAGLGEREELLAAAWLASLRAPRTRREALTELPRTGAPDDVYAAVETEFSPEETAALTFAIVAVNGWNRVAIGLRSDVLSLDGLDLSEGADLRSASGSA